MPTSAESVVTFMACLGEAMATMDTVPTFVSRFIIEGKQYTLDFRAAPYQVLQGVNKLGAYEPALFPCACVFVHLCFWDGRHMTMCCQELNCPAHCV